MRSLLCLTVVVTCLLAATLSEGSPLGIFKSKPAIQHAFQSLKEFFSFVAEHSDHVLSGHRQRRQAPGNKCLKDYQQTMSNRFLTCNDILEEIQDAEVLQRNATDRFCRINCPRFMLELARNLTRDCDFPDTLDPAIVEFLNQSCALGPNRTPCLVIWNNTESLLNDGTSTEAVTYQKCLEENHQNDKICNTDCKPAEQWISDNMGCCYKALVDYYRSLGETDYLLTDDNWDICNVKEPETCNSGPRTVGPNRPPPRTRAPPKN